MISSNTVSAVEPRTEQYHIRQVRLHDAGEPFLSDWNAFEEPSDAEPRAEPMMHNPQWLRGYFAGQLENLHVYSLYQSGSLCGIAPFLSKDWPLQCHLGVFTVAELPIRRMRLLGIQPHIPEEESAYDLLFSELARQKNTFDAIYLEGVPLNSFLWKYLKTSPRLPQSFRRYVPEPPIAHRSLRFSGSFTDYMKKFSSKQRNTLSRRVKKIREGVLGEMRFEQYTKPEEVDLFLEPAVEVSRKTYQWKLHHRGLSATGLLRQRLLFAAEHGWMRCYLLFCGGTPYAFLVGYQCGGRFVLDEIGFDPALSKYSAGTALHLMVIEDLFANNRPEVYDLGSGAAYKEMFSTESYLEGNAFLFRPGAYLRFAQESHRASQFMNKTASTAMDKLHLKSMLRKVLRGQASST